MDVLQRNGPFTNQGPFHPLGASCMKRGDTGFEGVPWILDETRLTVQLVTTEPLVNNHTTVRYLLYE